MAIECAFLPVFRGQKEVSKKFSWINFIKMMRKFYQWFMQFNGLNYLEFETPVKMNGFFQGSCSLRP